MLCLRVCFYQLSGRDTDDQGGIVYLTTAEAAVFEIMSDSKHPAFLKEILPLVKEFAQIKKKGQMCWDSNKCQS